MSKRVIRNGCCRTLDMHRCRAGTDAGGALGRETVDTGTVASGARINPGEPGEALDAGAQSWFRRYRSS
jgi:hypothetical protein